MKSRYTSATAHFLIVVLVSLFSIGTTTSQSAGRLIVLRAPNFGCNLAINLQIDGGTAANLVQGCRYDHSLPAGRHVLTVSSVPSYNSYAPTSTVLNVRPGQTYVFSAVWRDTDSVVLVPSALPPGQFYHFIYRLLTRKTALTEHNPAGLLAGSVRPLASSH